MYDENFEHGNESFMDRHPILGWSAILGFLVFAGIPAAAMLSQTVACAVGATNTWCPDSNDASQK